ncbi:unnamed protein product [Pleuronectes platessa]|uniref:Uncharacterized protein n=1 Tax=Pleuronectes platessa TaxID=8262 RepID=A0A9N7TZ92_PLEPL|nr:unnamed protein product [Pleuronectes platessa]
MEVICSGLQEVSSSELLQEPPGDTGCDSEPSAALHPRPGEDILIIIELPGDQPHVYVRDTQTLAGGRVALTLMFAQGRGWSQVSHLLVKLQRAAHLRDSHGSRRAGVG